MIDLLAAVLIFVLVFGVDYLRYIRSRDTYAYVSYETWALFLAGQGVIVYLFWDTLQIFISNIVTEVSFIGVLLLAILTFAYTLAREKLLVCHTTSRTERCLTPGYVLVKGTEITFQQLVYAVIAFSLIPLIGGLFYTYIAYLCILLIMHTPVVLSMNASTTKWLSFGILAISAPVFYSFTEFSLFWLAIYLHSLLYVFLWLTFANWEGKTVHVTHET